MELLEYILEHETDPTGQEWDWLGLSRNAQIPLEEMQKHPEIPWVGLGLMGNASLTFEQMLEIPSHIGQNLEGVLHFLTYGQYTLEQIKTWDFYLQEPSFVRNSIVRNKRFSLATLLADPEINWCRYHLSAHPDLTLEQILHPPSNLSAAEWNFLNICSYARITWDDIQSHPELPWNWNYLGENPNLPLELLLEKNPTPYKLSMNPQLTLKFVLGHPEVNWNWMVLSGHPNFPIEYFLEHQPNCLSDPANVMVYHNPSLTLSHLLDHPEISWQWNLVVSRLKSDPRYLAFSERKAALMAMVEELEIIPSYLSLLPRDMWTHYREQYLEEWVFRRH